MPCFAIVAMELSQDPTDRRIDAFCRRACGNSLQYKRIDKQRFLWLHWLVPFRSKLAQASLIA